MLRSCTTAARVIPTHGAGPHPAVAQAVTLSNAQHIEQIAVKLSQGTALPAGPMRPRATWAQNSFLEVQLQHLCVLKAHC